MSFGSEWERHLLQLPEEEAQASGNGPDTGPVATEPLVPEAASVSTEQESAEAQYEARVKRAMEDAYESARDFYDSPEYRELPAEVIRELNLKGTFNVFAVSRLNQEWKDNQQGLKVRRKKKWQKEHLAEGNYLAYYTDFNAFAGETNELFDGKYYATDIPNEADVMPLDAAAADKSVEMRELLPTGEVLGNLAFATNEMLQYCKDEEEAKAVRDLTQGYEGFLRSKEAVFTRKGPRSAYDILSDYYVTAYVVEDHAARQVLKTLGRGSPVPGSTPESSQTRRAVDELETILNSCATEQERDELFKLYSQHVSESMATSTRLMEVCQRTLEANSYQNITHQRETELPVELAVVLQQNSKAQGLLDTLRSSGSDVLFVSRQATDPTTLEAIHEIGKDTQNRYQTNWLPELVSSEKMPKITYDLAHERRLAILRKELAAEQVRLRALEAKHEQSEREGNAKLSEKSANQLQGLRDKIQQDQLELNDEGTKQTRLAKLQSGAERIRDMATKYRRVEVVDPNELNPEQQAALKELNELLEPIAREFAGDKMQWDISNKQTAEGVGVLKKMFLAGPSAEIMESAMPAITGESAVYHYIGKIIAGAVDDMVGEYGEWVCNKGQGVTFRELFAKRAVSLGVSAAVASGLLIGAEYVGKQGEHSSGTEDQVMYRALGGAMFGLGATLVSQVTAVQTIRMFDQARRVLLSEGKLTAMDFMEESDGFREAFNFDAIKRSKDITHDDLMVEIRKAFDIMSEKERQRKPEMILAPEEIEELRERIKQMDKSEIEALINTQPDEQELTKFAAQKPGERDVTKFVAYSAKFKHSWDEMFRLPVQKVFARKVGTVEEGAEGVFSALGDMKLQDMTSGIMPYDDAEREQVLQDLSKFDVSALLKMIEASPSTMRFWKAVKQDFNHPARLGVFIGSLAAIAGGSVSWAVGLKNIGFVNAGLGCLETTGGVVAAVGSKVRFDMQWQANMRSRLQSQLVRRQFAARDMGDLVSAPDAEAEVDGLRGIRI
jgi:hypothetical protein